MKFFDPEEVKAITPYWDGERMPDGRPKVSDDLLRRLRTLNTEEIWGVFVRDGFNFQFTNNLKPTRPGEVLVGRAVTTAFVPLRPDFHEAMMAQGKSEGWEGEQHKWIIDQMVEHDVFVVDLFGKIKNGTIVGGNLSTLVHSRTKDGGIVVDGAVRDLQQIEEIEGLQIYLRGADPTAIREVTMIGANIPVKIDGAVCMPGDVVFGTSEGVLFIPPQYVERGVIHAEKTKVRDVFGFTRLKEGTYTGAQIDGLWAPEIWDDFLDWFKNSGNEEIAEYSYLDYSEDVVKAKEMWEERQKKA